MFIYIHIPFCESKCKYCRFASFGGFQELKINKYVNYLIKEIESLGQIPPSPLNKWELKGDLSSIYFGGGTPSVLKIEQLEKIINLINSKKDKKVEITLETTPINLTELNLIGWKNIGINRISIGLQSLSNDTLKEIGRGNKGDILKSLEIVEKVGFDNINLDFIIGLPFVKKGELKKDIEFLLEKYQFIKHISVYMLEDYYDIKEDIDSKFEKVVYPNDWSKLGIKEEEFLEEYIEIKNFLKTKGFESYEISNFSKPGYNCKHNKAYWNHSNVIGFGLGASGFLDGKRTTNSDNFIDYYSNKNIFSEALTKQELFLEKIMFGLRTIGIEKQDYELLNQEKIELFIQNGFLKVENNLLKLQDKGILVLDYILREI